MIMKKIIMGIVILVAIPLFLVSCESTKKPHNTEIVLTDKTDLTTDGCCLWDKSKGCLVSVTATSGEGQTAKILFDKTYFYDPDDTGQYDAYCSGGELSRPDRIPNVKLPSSGRFLLTVSVYMIDCSTCCHGCDQSMETGRPNYKSSRICDGTGNYVHCDIKFNYCVKCN